MLDANLQGVRDDLVEAVIDPGKLTTYGISLDQLVQGVAAGNSLVAAGAMEGAEGSYAVKVPALIETIDDAAEPADRGRAERHRPGARDRRHPLDLQGRQPRSPGSTASRRSRSRSPSAPAPT